MKRDFYSHLAYARALPILGRFAYYALKILGIELPRSVAIGEGLELVHGGFGVVVHSKTKIGKNVKIYPGVTIGRADIYTPIEKSLFEGIIVEDDTILCPGSKILCKKGILRIGQGTVVGANAVLFNETGKNEIWAGIPAKLIGKRPE